MNIDTIIDPVSGQSYNINESFGKNLLKQYIRFYQTGGTNESAAAGGGAKEAAAGGGTNESAAAGGVGGTFYDTFKPNLVSKHVDMPECSAAASSMLCPVYIDPEGNLSYLGVKQYDRVKAEALGYNKILVNDKIMKDIETLEGAPMIYTWILFMSNEPAQTGFGHILVAVRNDSVYEFSAKHNTIMNRLFTDENYSNLLMIITTGDKLNYVSSGELKYNNKESKIKFNLQSSTYYFDVIKKHKNYNEDRDAYFTKIYLRTCLGLGDQPQIDIEFEHESFIKQNNEITPEYYKILKSLEEERILQLGRYKNKQRCIQFVTNNITIKIDQFKTVIQNLIEIRNRSTKPMFKQLYDKQIEERKRQIRQLECTLEELETKNLENVKDSNVGKVEASGVGGAGKPN